MTVNPVPHLLKIFFHNIYNFYESVLLRLKFIFGHQILYFFFLTLFLLILFFNQSTKFKKCWYRNIILLRAYKILGSQVIRNQLNNSSLNFDGRLSLNFFNLGFRIAVDLEWANGVNFLLASPVIRNKLSNYWDFLRRTSLWVSQLGYWIIAGARYVQDDCDTTNEGLEHTC